MMYDGVRRCSGTIVRDSLQARLATSSHAGRFGNTASSTVKVTQSGVFFVWGGGGGGEEYHKPECPILKFIF